MTISSSKFFTAAASKQYDDLIQMYGNTAIEALQNYQNVQMRWISQEHSNNQRSSREEKFDESLSNHFASGYSPPRGNENRISTLRKVSGGRNQGRNSKSIAESRDLLREFSSFILHPEYDRMELDPSKQPLQPSSVVADRQWDAGQVVRDAVSSLTEVRPPSDFAIYPGGVIVQNNENDVAIRSSTGYSSGGNNVSSDSLTIDPQTRTGPPIFDGAVANATPNFGTSGGGGIGTALHAVAALDHPLTMSLLLAMGADTRASHTAFRRLVHHEAACNGSIQCLTLLLELGNRYAEELLALNDSLSSNQSTSFKKVASTSLPDAAASFPFFSRPSNAIVENFDFLRSNQVRSWKRLEDSTCSSTDILQLLRLFHYLAKQVENGSMPELDAARIMVQRASLSDETKVSLAIQCGYHLNNFATISTPFTIRSPNGSSSDGHGNSPLHWAAFKNETECISLLLKYRADPNARAHPSGWTPLHDAAYSNGRDAIALLVDAGAIVDARASSGATPLCFAAQEDASEAVELLLIRGAELGTRCIPDAVPSSSANDNNSNERQNVQQTRFSGYTPLHYCAHYNASKAAKLLLQHHTALAATEIRDLNGRLPIHVAVARGSSSVLRELLVAGARVETRSLNRHHSSSSASPIRRQNHRNCNQNDAIDTDNIVRNDIARSAPSTPSRRVESEEEVSRTAERAVSPPRTLLRRGRSNLVNAATPVSSPLLRSMIPSQPIQSSKPWNCLTQRSIDECRQLISEVEQNWTPDRHSLFTPADRRAVAALLRVGKRLEAEGSLPFTYLWPEVLSFCGRGWFELEEEDTETTYMECLDDAIDKQHLALPNFC